MNKQEEYSKGTAKTKNDININNNFSLSIHFGDSLNLFALIIGFFFINRVSKQYKINKKLQKESREKND
ncbi:hypothetical protein [Bacillus sp. FJAT-29937]|uniref:hypothetical protein n=1 Tax=Bacillus sp. FJAT-29937 TaxID=1720553 RepID=UPI000833300B|nr:hypothetical protein [Bacillus sp. FJAT-29937]